MSDMSWLKRFSKMLESVDSKKDIGALTVALTRTLCSLIADLGVITKKTRLQDCQLRMGVGSYSVTYANMAIWKKKVTTTNMVYMPKNRPTDGFDLPVFHCNHNSAKIISSLP